MTDDIDYVVDDPVATITLQRPATLNALTHPMLRAFREAVEALRLGLVQQVVAPDDLLDAARRYVVDLAENVSPASLDRPDAEEGAAALLEKRAPVFPRLGDDATSSDHGPGEST